MREELHSYFGSGISMKGVLRFKGALRFDGDFDGEVQTEGTFIVGEHGKVNALINTGTLYNMGEVVGDVKAKDNISIYLNSTLSGNIDTPVLISEEGAIFQGNCKMTKSANRKPSSSAPSADFISRSMPVIPSSGSHGGEGHSNASSGSFIANNKVAVAAVTGLVVILVLVGAYVTNARSSIGSSSLSRMIYRHFAQDNADHLKNLADTWFEEGHYPQAADTYRMVLEKSPDNAGTLLNLGISLENSGNMDSAAESYARYVEANPKDKEIIKKLSEHFASTGDNDGLVRLYEVITTHRKDDITAVKRLFNLYLDTGNKKMALDLYRTRIAVPEPTFQDLMTMGGLQRDLNQLAEAATSFEKAVALEPQNFDAQLSLAYTYQRGGYELKAATAFRNVGRLNPDHPEAINNTAFFHLNSGRADKAIEFFNITLVQDPKNLRAYHGLATSFIKKGENDRAEYYCKKGLEIDPDYAPTLNRLAWTYAVQNKMLDQAEKYSEDSMKFFADIPDYMDTLSEIFYRLGKYNESVNWISKAMNIDPTSNWYRSQLSKFQAALEKENAAKNNNGQ